MFYICESHLSDPQPVAAERIEKELRPAHVRFVAEGVAERRVVFGGPKTAGDGGFILVSAPSRAACDAFLARDPMVQAGAQSYAVSEFLIMEHDPCIDPLL